MLSVILTKEIISNGLLAAIVPKVCTTALCGTTPGSNLQQIMNSYEKIYRKKKVEK